MASPSKSAGRWKVGDCDPQSCRRRDRVLPPWDERMLTHWFIHCSRCRQFVSLGEPPGLNNKKTT